jgi:hypothetical protein
MVYIRANTFGAWTSNIAGAAPVNYTIIIEISAVRYVAHIVDMKRDFYDMLRNLQAQSGGSLMIGSSTFRHSTHSYSTTAAGTLNEDINISARVRSLENLLFVNNRTANLTDRNTFSLSIGSSLGATNVHYNVFVGAVRYPSNQINFSATSNKGECYQELRKCFGSLGSINHGGRLNNSSYLSTATSDESANT